MMVFSIFFVDHLFNSVFEPNLFKQKIIRSKKIKFIHIKKKQFVFKADKAEKYIF